MTQLESPAAAPQASPSGPARSIRSRCTAASPTSTSSSRTPAAATSSASASDIPAHNIVRSTELAASRAAHAAGLSPAVRHAEPGVLVIDYIDGRTLAAEDVRDPTNLDRLAELVAPLPPRHPAALPRPGADVLGLPGGPRLRPHPRAERQPPSRALPRLLDGRRGAGGRRRARSRSSSATTTCCRPTSSTTAAASGWSTGSMPASTPALRPRRARLQRRADARPQRGALLDAYFGRPPDDALRRRYRGDDAPPRCCARRMWSMVSELHSADRLRLRRLHRREPRAVRGRLGRLPDRS